MKEKLLTLLLIIMFTSPLTATITHAQEDTKIKNIILLIGDGMGFNELTIGSLVEHGVEGGLFMQSDNFLELSISTDSADREITDSGASATALATGVKTLDRYIGKSPNGSNIQTILEYAESLGKATGLVTSVSFNDATPAAFASHAETRYNTETINTHMITKGIEVILGGGSFDLPTTNDMLNNNYTLIKEKSELLAIDTETIDVNLFGVFEGANLKYEADLDLINDVRLHEITSTALNILDNDPNGFFLMIESGRIDHAGHEGDIIKNSLEVIEFDRVIKDVYEWIQDNPDTLLIIVADHETGGLRIDGYNQLDNILPNTSIDEETMRQIRMTRAGQIDATMTDKEHFPYNVPFISYGKGREDYIDASCDYNNAHIFGIMKNAIDGTVPTRCPDWIPGYTGAPVASGDKIFGPPPLTSTSTSSSSSSKSDDSPFIIPIFALAIPFTLIYLKKKS